jgi:hypothetical protein
MNPMPPTPEDFLRMLLEQINIMLAQHGQHSMSRNGVRFVFTRDLRNRTTNPGGGGSAASLTVSTRRDALMSEQQFVGELANILNGGPAWVQATLMRTPAGEELIEVDCGQAVGASRPSPNATFVPQPVDVIIL